MSLKVLKEYMGPGKKGEQDIIIILRPQANNCYFESLLLSIIRSSPDYRKKIWLEYMANVPGEMIQEESLMERHYEYRLYYSKMGLKGMTQNMKDRFQSYFGVPAEASEVYGSFEALTRLDYTEQELFDSPIEKQNSLNVEGQSIRRLFDKDNKPVFVINYDIPALMTFNHIGTNSAIIMLRTTYSYKEFNRLILKILNEITDQILHSNADTAKGLRMHLSEEDIKYLKGTDFYRHKRLFHYSHGPFEQILDAREFLYNADGTSVPMSEYTFANYLEKQGISVATLSELIRNPIIQIKELDYSVEDSLYVYTRNMSYEKAYDIVNKIEGEYLTKLKDLVVHT